MIAEESSQYDEITKKVEGLIFSGIPSFNVYESTQDIPREAFRPALQDMLNKSEIAYSEYIKQNLFKLSDDLMLIKEHIGKQMQLIQKQVKGHQEIDDEEFFRKRRFIRKALERFESIPENEQVGCMCYLEKEFLSLDLPKESLAEQIVAIKSQLKTRCLNSIKAAFNKTTFGNLCRLGYEEEAVNVIEKTFWLQKGFQELEQSLSILKHEYDFDAEILLVDYVLKQERLFSMNDLDLFVRNYNETIHFAQSLSLSSRKRVCSKWPLNTYLNLRLVECKELMQTERIDIAASYLWKIYESHTQMKPIYTKIYKMLIEAYYTLADRIFDEKDISDCKKLVDAFNDFAVSDFISKEKELQEINSEYKKYFLDLLPKVIESAKDRLELECMQTFRELKLSELAMAISEKITETFTQITKFQKESSSAIDIGKVLSAYIENAKGRLVSCRKAFASLQKLKAAPAEGNLDPKIFLIRLEAEAAFINKYLSQLNDSTIKSLQSHPQYDALLFEIKNTTL